jgi:hypothetical protein
MGGRWTAFVARRLLRHETFERLVSPALADLQIEAHPRRARALRHYPALAFVIAVALLRDIHLDACALVHASGRRAWLRASLWSLAFTVLIGTSILRNTPLQLLGTSGQLAAWVSAILNGFIYTLPLSTAAIVFYVRRQRRLSIRAFATTTALCIAAAVAVQVATLPARSTLNQTMYGSVSLRISREAILPDDPEQHYLADEWRRWSMWRSELNSGPFPWRHTGGGRIGFVVGLLTLVILYVTQLTTFALFGIIIARGRGVTVLLRVIAVIALVVLSARAMLPAANDMLLLGAMAWAAAPRGLSFVRGHMVAPSGAARG